MALAMNISPDLAQADNGSLLFKPSSGTESGISKQSSDDNKEQYSSAISSSPYTSTILPNPVQLKRKLDNLREAAPPNDLCFNANLLSNRAIGSTMSATDDTVTSCGGVTSGEKGVWYQVEGTGSSMTVDTCSDTTNFDTLISVFQGSCSSLICIGGNDDTCGLQSSVTWETMLGTDYLIVVHAYAGESGGSFELQLSSDDTPDLTWAPETMAPIGSTPRPASPATTPSAAPRNDLCFNANPLSSRATGSTIGATDDTVTSCGGVTSGRKGVWYQVEGTGGSMTVDTCAETTDLDTRISVFRGSCSSLTCIDGDDDTCGTRSSVTWNTMLGRNYLIMVHAFYSGGSGTFELTLSMDAPDPTRAPATMSPTESTPRPTLAQTPPAAPRNDLCVNANLLSSRVIGSIMGATDDTVSSCGGVSNGRKGVWYQVEGTGSSMTVDTCADTTNFDTRISVFRGSCSNLICIDGDDDSCGSRSSISWDSTMGTYYLVMVHAYSSGVSGGSFELQLSSNGTPDLTLAPETMAPIGSTPRPASPATSPSAAPRNDLCFNANPLSSRATGSTVGATDDTVTSCGGVTSGEKGVWYQVEGTGSSMTIDTCSDTTNFDTIISVFQGSCSNLICIGGNDDTCGTRSSVTWDTRLGTDYLIVVHAYAGESGGSFELQLSSDDTPDPTWTPVTMTPIGSTPRPESPQPTQAPFSPITLSPITKSPITLPPITEPPTTSSPITGTPSTMAPTTRAPTPQPTLAFSQTPRPETLGEEDEDDTRPITAKEVVADPSVCSNLYDNPFLDTDQCCYPEAAHRQCEDREFCFGLMLSHPDAVFSACCDHYTSCKGSKDLFSALEIQRRLSYVDFAISLTIVVLLMMRFMPACFGCSIGFMIILELVDFGVGVAIITIIDNSNAFGLARDLLDAGCFAGTANVLKIGDLIGELAAYYSIAIVEVIMDFFVMVLHCIEVFVDAEQPDVLSKWVLVIVAAVVDVLEVLLAGLGLFIFLIPTLEGFEELYGTLATASSSGINGPCLLTCCGGESTG